MESTRGQGEQAMPHFRPIHVGALAAICSTISLGTSSDTGPPFKLDSTLSQGHVVVAFLDTSASDETSDNQGKGKNSDDYHGMNNNYGRGKNNNSFTATAHGSALFVTTAAGSTNRQPMPQRGADGSNSPKPRSPTTLSSNGHAVAEPDPPALLMMALFGLGMKGYCSERVACRVPARP